MDWPALAWGTTNSHLDAVVMCHHNLHPCAVDTPILMLLTETAAGFVEQHN